ncbi:MAG: hypothetical protein CBB65_13935 [Hyphomonadaceae bacterium TMED5]|nr:MAG: hypothetical protein CBB65_13935 [Hyphomonadaceae bacterium TMED5]
MCNHIDLPANAFLTSSSYGPGWDCERGFYQTEASCETVILPANAHLNYSGDGWDCNRPYKQVGEACRMP